MLHVSLFGRLRLGYKDVELKKWGSLKSRELFVYLLLHRDRSHAREKIASDLWGDRCTTAQSKKYLRNALWQLQTDLKDCPDLFNTGLLQIEPGWIRLHMNDLLRVDAHIFETAYTAVEGVGGAGLDDEAAAGLERALQLYRGDLLESWYQEWCLYEREKMLQIYLIMLDKMMAYSEVHGRFEAGLSYGRRILLHDRARECTHRRLMRLYYLSGDRSTALRQFERCEQVLEDELRVAPSRRTVELYRDLRADRWASGSAETAPDAVHPDLVRVLHGLRSSLARQHHHLRHAAKTLENILRAHRDPSQRR